MFFSGSNLDLSSEYVDDFDAIANAYIRIWSSAVNVQARRILSASPNYTLNTLSDTALFIIALNNLRSACWRYVEVLGMPISVKKVPPHQWRARRTLRESLLVFEEKVPNVERLRHTMIHFEDYAYGIGRSQKTTKKPSPIRLRHEYVDETFKFRVLDSGYKDPLEIDIKLANDAVNEMLECLIDIWVDLG